MMTEPLPRQSRIGIIGGGQLGRMLALAAARMGYRCTILEPQAACPAAEVADRHIVAAYDDASALAELAKSCAVVTYEFENIDAQAIKQLETDIAVYPPSKALEVSQDRVTEKTFLAKAGLETAPWHDIASADDLTKALDAFGGRGILKTRRFGYDGKGQIRFDGTSKDPSPADALSHLDHAPAILEGFIDFRCEISVIATRALDGSTACYEPARNEHEGGILARSHVPSGVSDQLARQAQHLATALLNQLDYVGTLGLEFFVTSDDRMLANEFAPRVHNSGHWTEAACAVSQFEQHIGAISGWALGNTSRHSDCIMENVLGEAINRLPSIAETPNVVIHDYGKAEPKPGRKMGHFTRLFASKGA